MAYTTSYNGPNSGFQLGHNLGHITAQFLQSETSLNQACLQDLRTTDPHHDKDRIQMTNGGLLKDSYCWILDNEEFQQWQQDNQSNCLLWIRGDPGKGKTMLLCGIIEELTRSLGDTISFFFCQATDVRINSATAVLRGLLYGLVEKQPSLLSYVQVQYEKAGKALFEDTNAWNALSRIFMDILKDTTLKKSTHFIIDALDECTTDLTLLLDLITQVSLTYPHAKWIVSSRNWPDIEERLNTTQTTQISLELNEASVSKAVGKFIQHKTHHLAKVKKYTDETRDTICRYLSSNSQGTFLWVALVCQDLNRAPRWRALKKLEMFPSELNALYRRMIDQVHISEDAECCKRILAVMSMVYRPITFDELASLVELPDDLSKDCEALSEIIAICGSFLTMRDDTINFVHQSAKEFLQTQNNVFPRGIEAEHHAIFSRSLQAMLKTLRRDIFQLKFPGFPIEKVTPPSPNPLAAAKYACVFWVDHLQGSESDEINDLKLSLDENGLIDIFLEERYLHWLEALSILRSVSYGIEAIQKLEILIQEKSESKALLYRARDASRFIQYYRTVIESSPLQVYYSPLIFSPTATLTRRCYQKERTGWVLNYPVVEENWSACLQTLEGHSDSVNSIAWSQDESRLASASSDKTIRIWDPFTGQSISTLKGHSRYVESIAWSQDKSRLASASDEIRIWDLVTGQTMSSFKGHDGFVKSLVWSQDETQLAIGSYDNMVRIWNLTTNQRVSTIEGHGRSVRSIAWSQDRSQLALGSIDGTIGIWNPNTGQSISTLKGHKGSIRSIAWSPDGSRLVSACDASNDMAIRIWDPATGRILLSFKAHSCLVNSIAWSQDGTLLALAYTDATVRIRNAANGQSVSTLEGHSNSVTSVAWSQDGSRLASGSFDKTVRIWDLTVSQTIPNFEKHSQSVKMIAWSQDGSRLASGSRDKTVRIWDPATGQIISTLNGHSGFIESIAWSQDGSRLASGSWDKTVRIWDPATGQIISTLNGHSGFIESIAWSQDGSQLASGSSDKTVRIWNSANGQTVSTLEGHRDWVTSIAWSQDGSQLASGSDDKTVRIWDPATGQIISTLEGHSGHIESIAWSQDGSRLTSGSRHDKTVRIWDLATGQCTSTAHVSSSDLLQFNHLYSGISPSMGFVTSNGYSLSDDGFWITFDGVKLLWLPADYRPNSKHAFAILANKMAIGCSSGRVIFLTLAEQNPIAGH